MRLTRREKEFLLWMVRLQYMSTSQISRFFPRVKQSARLKIVRCNLSKLEQRGLVASFDEPPSGKVGRPEKVFYVPRRTRAVVLPIIRLDDWQGYTFSVPRNTMYVRHHLEINDFLLMWKDACNTRNLQFDFLAEFHMVRGEKRPEKYITIDCPHPYNHRKRLRVTPDWVNTLENPVAKKNSLFIGELDRGTEPLVSRKMAGFRTDVQTKLLAYREFLEEAYNKSLEERGLRGFDQFSREFGYSFKGFRVLFVTSRPESIIKLCNDICMGEIVWVTDRDSVTVKNIFGPIWTVPGSAEKQSLLGRRKCK